MKASTALAALLGLDLAALAMVLAIAWQRSGRFDAFDTLFLLVFLVLLPLLLGGFGRAMPDPRPIVFFGTFMGLILLPWLAAYAAFGPGMLKESGQRPAQATAAAPAMPPGANVQDMAFADEAEARRHALENFGGARRGETTIAGQQGFLLSTERPVVFMRQEGRVLRFYQAQDRAQLEQLLTPRAARPAERAAEPATPDLVDRVGMGPLLAGLLVYGLFVAWVFLRLAGWAVALPPREGVAPVPAAALRERLLAVAGAEVPFSVREGDAPGVFVAEWRYADARWLDLARAHRVHQAIRYVMRMDEASHSVRVLEYRAAFDASAGAGGASLQYRASRGITFFEKRRETLFGLQIRDGVLTPDLAYTWRFDVEEIRGPLAKTVNDCGWSWKPLMLDVPWLAG